MSATQSYTSDSLRVEVSEDPGAITMGWFGKSTMRKPGDFLTPIITDLLKRGAESGRRVVLDFRSLQYMNSSTITPVIRALEQTRRGTGRMSVLFRADLKWQHLSFTALKIFETTDARIEIKGAE
jgi:hypothetical protein